jgi:hypothetical protein
MTVGTTSNFNLGRNEIITEALRELRVIGVNQTTATGNQIAMCSTRLNLMLRAWQADGLHVWTQQTGVLFQTTNQAKYSTDADRMCNIDDLVITSVATAEVAGATVIGVDDSTDMTAADEIGILLDDQTMQWTTIVSVDSPTQVTITDALTDDAAIGNNVYAFTTRLGKIVKIYDDIRVRNMTTGTGTQYNETPIFLFSRQEYNILSNKTNTGLTSQVYFQPLRDNSQFYLWPVPANDINLVLFTYERNLLDFDTSTNFADAPAEWTRTFVMCLAAEVGNLFGVPPERLNDIVGRANSMRENLLGWDNDQYSIRIQPDYRTGYHFG